MSQETEEMDIWLNVPEFPPAFLDVLDSDFRAEAEHVYATLYRASAGRINVRLWQLQVMISTLKSRDVILSAGTGSGKTLAFILPLVADPTTYAITISPLKCLQSAHV